MAIYDGHEKPVLQYQGQFQFHIYLCLFQSKEDLKNYSNLSGSRISGKIKTLIKQNIILSIAYLSALLLSAWYSKEKFV